MAKEHLKSLLTFYTQMGVDEVIADEPADQFLVARQRQETVTRQNARYQNQKEQYQSQKEQYQSHEEQPHRSKEQDANQQSAHARFDAIHADLNQRAPKETAIERSQYAEQTSAGGGKALSSDDTTTIDHAKQLAQSAQDLSHLAASLNAFEGCNLKKTAKKLVFGEGATDARVMFIGEAPGRDEDLSGRPFVGRSGMLLEKMLAAIGLTREEVYITNVIPWRPPGNRTPTPFEKEVCRPFIERHISFIAPEFIVMLGASPAQILLDRKDGILKMRGRWQSYDATGSEIRAMATLHPAYLLRQPAQKKLAWQDFIKLKMALDGREKAD